MSLQHLRILIVEDEYLLGVSLYDSLERLGATVVGPIGNIPDALHILAQCEVDLAVLDIDLRGVAVYPVADTLQDMRVPFLFSTGYDETSVPVRFRNHPLVRKPCEIDSLVAAIESLIGMQPQAPGTSRQPAGGAAARDADIQV